jgi:hypothetical protein
MTRSAVIEPSDSRSMTKFTPPLNDPRCKSREKMLNGVHAPPAPQRPIRS